MTVPVVASLSKRYPNDRFIIASKKKLDAMFAPFSNVEFYEVDNHLDWNGVWELWHALRDQVDAVIDLQNIQRTFVLGALMRLSGKPVTRVRYGRLRKQLITLFGIGKKNLPTEFERYQDAFRRAGLETNDAFEALPVNTAASKTVIERYGQKEGRWIGLAPFAKSKSNMLPYRVTKEIIERLTTSQICHSLCSFFPCLSLCLRRLPRRPVRSPVCSPLRSAAASAVRFAGSSAARSFRPLRFSFRSGLAALSFFPSRSAFPFFVFFPPRPAFPFFSSFPSFPSRYGFSLFSVLFCRCLSCSPEARRI